MSAGASDEGASALATFRQFFALERDVLVLSLAMFAFSLGFQMTSRYVPRYMSVLGAGAGVIGLYGSVGNLVGAAYPYPGGALSDRLGSRRSLTLFGLLSAVGFGVWLLAPALDGPAPAGVPLPVWAVFLGLFLTQAWKSLGLGATFAVVKQSVPPGKLAAGFASTEVFRRVGFLVGPLLAAGLLAAAAPDFVVGFQWILAVAVVVAVAATVLQRVLYDPTGDSIGAEFAGVEQVLADLRSLPGPLRPLLVADTLVRFANGMAYVFFVIVVTEFLRVGATLPVLDLRLGPDAYFGVLLGVEMAVALVVMPPAARAAERVGLKPVVAAGFFVYGAFPVLLINAPADAAVLAALFAFSGLRFAGLPAHKALIVGPAERDAGGRVTGTYYLVRNAVGIPSAALGGAVYALDPVLSFTLASAVGLLGTGYFLAFGREFEAYA